MDTKRLKTAAIGSGFIGAAHVEALKRVSGADVVALVDTVNPIQKAKELNVPNGSLDYREVIEAVEPDYIHICTPNHTHKEIAFYVFRHGIHITCEKPTARNARKAEETLEAAKKSNPAHAINLHNRFYPTNHQLHNMVLGGALGKVYGVHEACLQDYFSKESDLNWRMLSSKGGSTRVTSDIGSHWIDLAEYVIGSKVKEVFAEFQTNLPVRKMGLVRDLKDVVAGTEDTSYVIIRFENGAVGSAVFFQAYQGRENQTTTRVSGSETSVGWDSKAIGDLELGHRNEPNRLLTKNRGLAHPDIALVIVCPGGHAEEFPDVFRQNFITVYGAIRGVESIDLCADFGDGLHQMQVLGKIFESVKIGRWISVN